MKEKVNNFLKNIKKNFLKNISRIFKPYIHQQAGLHEWNYKKVLYL